MAGELLINRTLEVVANDLSELVVVGVVNKFPLWLAIHGEGEDHAQRTDIIVAPKKDISTRVADRLNKVSGSLVRSLGSNVKKFRQFEKRGLDVRLGYITLQPIKVGAVRKTETTTVEWETEDPAIKLKGSHIADSDSYSYHYDARPLWARVCIRPYPTVALAERVFRFEDMVLAGVVDNYDEDSDALGRLRFWLSLNGRGVLADELTPIPLGYTNPEHYHCNPDKVLPDVDVDRPIPVLY